MCGIIYVVGDKGSDCWICREAVIIVKFAGVKFKDIEEEFIVSSTLGEGHIICKGEAVGLVFRI